MNRLDAAAVQQPLSERAREQLEALEVFDRIASTNTYLMTQTPPSIGRYRVAIADQQTSGRGRHERRWISEPGAGLYMSLAYTFAAAVRDLAGLTLAIGVAVAEALEELGISGISLKWPNDIVALDGKLGGILTEVQSGRSDGVTVVTGVGLNLASSDRLEFGAESQWSHRPVDLGSVTGSVPHREQIAATLIEHFVVTFGRFEHSGLDDFMQAWRRRDWLLGREITVDMQDQRLTGRAAGVGNDGSLLVDTPAGQVSVISGSIITADAREPGE